MRIVLVPVLLLSFGSAAFADGDLGTKISCDPWADSAPRVLGDSINKVVSDAYDTGASEVLMAGKYLKGKKSKVNPCLVSFEYYDAPKGGKKKFLCREIVDMCEIIKAEQEASEGEEQNSGGMCKPPPELR